MPHSFTNLLYHIVFATKGRQEWLDADLRPKLFAYLGELLHDRAGGGVEDVELGVVVRGDPHVAAGDDGWPVGVTGAVPGQ